MQTSIKTVADHLILPHQQLARKRGRTLYTFANAKVHSDWEGGEKTRARKTLSVTNEKRGQVHEEAENIEKGQNAVDHMLLLACDKSAK